MNVFCYWRNLDGTDDIPPYIDLCLDSIKKHHPNVELITPKNLSVDVPKEWHEKIPAHQADILRPLYLYKYGGLFLDIDTVVFQNFFESEYYDKDKFVIGFQYGFRKPTIGVLYSKKGSMLMKAWSDNQMKNISKGDWTAFGSQSLWSCEMDETYLGHSAEAVQPFKWEETQKFNLGVDVDLSGKFGCALFNKVLPKNIKSMSKQELLDSGHFIGKLYREGLK